jgi:hypothetical protein
LRAVPLTPSLPFFDEPTPTREFPVLDTAPAARAERVIEPVKEPVSEAVQDSILAADERERLEELLDELEGLKIRLKAVREH